MRCWVKWIGIGMAIPLVLLFLVSVLLYIPPVQQFAINKAAQYAGEATGMQFRVEQIRLDFPLNMTVQGIEVLATPADTMLQLESLHVEVALLPLLKKEVQVRAIDMNGAQINTGTFLEGMSLKGILGKLHLEANSINLTDEQATLNTIDLSDTSLTLLLNDTTTTEEDTISTSINWLLKLGQLQLNRVMVAIQLPADSLRLASYIRQAELQAGSVDLGRSAYGARQFALSGATLDYDSGYSPVADGFDPSHIALNDVTIMLDSLYYAGRDMEAYIRSFTARDRSGLQINSLTGQLQSDSVAIHFPELLLKTTVSEANLQAHIPWITIGEHPEGEMNISLAAQMGKSDILTFAGALPKEFQNAYPSVPLMLKSVVSGNLDVLHLEELQTVLPGAFQADAYGTLRSVTDSLRRSGKLTLSAATDSLDFLLTLLPANERNRYAIPTNMTLEGASEIDKSTYRADLLFREGQGSIELLGEYDAANRKYSADLKVDSLEPFHFLPLDSLYYLAASVKAEGEGLDIFHPATWATLQGGLSDIHYGNYQVSDVTLSGDLRKNRLTFDLHSRYPLAALTMQLNASLSEENIHAMLSADVSHLDLYGMHLLNDSLTTSFQLFAEAETDLKRSHLVDVTLGNWELVTPTSNYTPKTLTLRAQSTPDTTHVSFHAGDLELLLNGDTDVESLAEKFNRISDDMTRQLERDSLIDIQSLTPLLPTMHATISAGKDNPIHNLLHRANLTFHTFNLEATTSPNDGISMNGALINLMSDTTRIDTIRIDLHQDTTGLLYAANVIKNAYRKQVPFTAGLHGRLQSYSADAELLYTDGGGRTGLHFGLHADKVADGLRANLFPDTLIVAFRPFTVNPGNYIIYKDPRNITADLRLTGEQNASLWLHSVEDGLSDALHLELSQIRLDIISNALPVPEMDGIFSADMQYAPLDSTFMVVLDANIDNLIYDGKRVGELLFNTVYLPLENNEHQADMHFIRDREEILSATAHYRSGRNDHLEGMIDITKLPLSMLTPFIPQNMASLSGRLSGNMRIQGSTDAPTVQGELTPDSAAVFVTALGTTFRLDNRPIRVEDNLLHLDTFHIHAYGDNPFVIDGKVNLENLHADLNLSANRMQLLDVKRNKESMVYGKLLVNLASTVRGPLDALVMRGNLQLLGGTDVTYVLQDSPLTVQDRLSDLVTFTSFEDTLLNRRRRPEAPLPLGGMDMLLTIRIDESVRLNADITPDRSSKVQLEGGGDLSFQYTPQGDMILNGRYTLTGGTVEYALPIIPLKEFSIQNGSYVQWNGDAMNPLLSLTATERIRATVNDGSSGSRMVSFDVGIALQQQLENLALQFILSAPEDQSMQTTLNAMGEDERTKLAVGMIITGMYLASGDGKQNLNMGAALNSFLNSEISNIAGSALKTVDISFGMETYDANGDGTGGQRTDYNFSFAKRFWDDRIRIVLGGRISTGATEQSGQTQAFIDNISIEYRLDATGSRYVKLFHNKNYESLLEGEITETGVGILLRRKMLHMRELFNFKRRDEE